MDLIRPVELGRNRIFLKNSIKLPSKRAHFYITT